MAIRVVFADDNYLVRQGVAALLGESAEVEVVATVQDAAELMATVAAMSPDAVLTDIRMPPTWTDEGLRAARQIRREHPRTGVVVLSQHVDPVDVGELLSEGVAGLGYLLKERIANLDEIVAALGTVCRGGSALDPLVVELLLARRAATEPSALASLTEREVAVLREMATGKNNLAIARVLRMSERAVEKHTNALFAKLGVSEERDVNRRVLAVLAFLEATSTSGRPPERRPGGAGTP
jgi:DNA-binding NarL/FixJ family response regulator